MISNKFFSFKIVSSDGKIFTDNINELYIRNSNNDIVGVLANHYKMVVNVPISIFKIIKENKETKFVTSGGILNVKDNIVTLLCDTFEKEDELDKERALKEKEYALGKLSVVDKDDIEKVNEFEFSLKKAINRLSLFN